MRAGFFEGMLAMALLLWPGMALAQDSAVLPEIQVISTSPLSGVGIDREKVPALVQSVTSDDISRSYNPNFTDTLFQRIPGISASDQQGSSFQTDIRYRGFVASPVPGQPQGIAVYMNGIRVNEAFGDTVNFDFIPSNAVDRADVQSNNPVFGLNALGGALNLQMKNGFTFQGFEAEFQGGSYGRLNGNVQFGMRKDDVALYIAAQGLNERGWRQNSPSELARVYGDVGWRHDGNEMHLVLSAASNSFGVVSAAPIELLQRDWTATYTWPQTTQNQNILAAINGKYLLADNWTLQSNVYLRSFRQAHLDGNGADVERCSNASSFPNQLCLQDDGFPRPSPVSLAFRNQFVVLDQNNNPIPCPPGAGNTCASVPYGTIDRTNTDTLTAGASLQATNDAKLFAHENRFTVGGSIDHSWTKFTSANHPHTRQSRFRSGRSCRAEHLLWALCDRHVRHHVATRADRRRPAQRRAPQDGGSDRRVARSQQRPDLHAAQSACRADLQGDVGTDALRRLFGIEPGADALGNRLLQSQPALPDRKRACRGPAAAPGAVAQL